MTDLTRYLRRCDVEGLLTTKINASDERIADWNDTLTKMLGAEKPDFSAAHAQLQRIVDEQDRAGALRVALKHLDHCEQFTLHAGHETNEAGIAELRDASGQNVEPDGRRWRNEG